VLLLAVFAIALACLVFSYFYLRSDALEWPPAGIALPGLFRPSLMTGIALAGAGAAYFAHRSIRRGKQAALVLGLAGSFGMLILLLGVQLVEYLATPFGPQTHAYGSLFFTILGFHSALVLGGLAISAVTQVQAWLGYFTAQRNLAVENTAIYAYFVAASWLIVYGLLYLSPRLL
ncbi:MAG: heme-copper oxidase subunit III, partial [Chloroflexi bacterium]|nr:heme-copper oxidase subunit III [Chloroflexota bacterium]